MFLIAVPVHHKRGKIGFVVSEGSGIIRHFVKY